MQHGLGIAYAVTNEETPPVQKRVASLSSSSTHDISLGKWERRLTSTDRDARDKGGI
jgi:hypothetical protein